ncbi:MAG: hypothetical protein ACTHKS_06680 [Gaiellaceae bacterium]
MAEVQEKVEAVQEKVSNASSKQVLTAAAAAAATTAATYAVKKALSHDHGNGHSNGNGAAKAKSAGSGLIASAAATSWDAASDVLLPMADEAAESAGKYVATHGPEILRERLIPKFIEAFEDAK